MSAELMSEVYKLRDPRLSPADRSVLLCYAFHVNHKASGNESWVSARTVAEETGYTPDGVTRSIGRLRGWGYLERVGKKSYGRGVWVWVYAVSTDVEVVADPAKESTSGRVLDAPVEAKESTSGRQGIDLRPDNREGNRNQPTETPDGVSARTLVAEWIDHCPTRPGSRVIGHVSRELKILFEDGIPVEVIRAGLAEWHRKRLSPSALASVVHTTSLGPAERPSTADQRLASGVALVARLEERERRALRAAQ